MAKKTNTKTFRLSDEMLDLIERQVGRTLSDKFENLVTRCVWEQPAKEAELERIQEEIQKEKERLKELTREYYKLNSTIRDLSYRASALKDTLNQKLIDWGV